MTDSNGFGMAGSTAEGPGANTAASPAAGSVVAILHRCGDTRAIIADAVRSEGASFICSSDVEDCLRQLRQSATADATCVAAEAALVATSPSFTDVLAREFSDPPILAVASDAPPIAAAAQSFRPWAVVPSNADNHQLRIAARAAIEEAQQRRADAQIVQNFYELIGKLSKEERDVMKAVCLGKLNKQIARELEVSIRTVEQRRHRVFTKMEVASAVPLASKWAIVRTIERLRPRLAARHPAAVTSAPITLTTLRTGVADPLSQTAI